MQELVHTRRFEALANSAKFVALSTALHRRSNQLWRRPPSAIAPGVLSELLEEEALADRTWFACSSARRRCSRDLPVSPAPALPSATPPILEAEQAGGQTLGADTA
jgi:hypothetical protein